MKKNEKDSRRHPRAFQPNDAVSSSPFDSEPRTNQDRFACLPAFGKKGSDSNAKAPDGAAFLVVHMVLFTFL
jgi:hypothetical protein